MIIRAKIAVNKIDKARLFRGKKDIYLDVTLLENRNGEDEFGNHGMIVQDVTKEERENGIKGAILGNFKIVGEKPKQQPQQTKPAPARDDDSDDIPF